MTKSVKVAIVEDQKEIREMLAVLIRGSEGFECIGTYENAEDAITGIPSIKPDVVLVDIHLPKGSGIDCVSNLKLLCDGTQYIMCTSLEDVETIFKALKAGANGYIVKSTPPAKLLEAISDVYNGGSPMSSQIARKVVGSFQESSERANNAMESLSKREQEILNLLSKGFRYKEIAQKLFVSIETVRTHIRNIYEKLQVNSRTEALNKVFPK
jgi:DNA-binding NarL/FixJ family response regulator